MPTTSSKAEPDETLSPAKRLASNPRLCRAGIETINDMATLRACVAYENATENRLAVLEQLARRAAELTDPGRTDE